MRCPPPSIAAQAAKYLATTGRSIPVMSTEPEAEFLGRT
jgi:hypothetical protein